VRFGTQEEYVTRFRTLLEIAVAERITADRLGVQVSGGMDSTSVAGIARLVMRRRGLPNDSVRGVTMVLGGNTGDEEGRYAELVARELDLELDTLVESSFEPTDPLAEPTPRTPEPTPYTWTTMQYESVRRSAAGARVLLTGLPGDSLLMFVPWYWAEWLGRGHPVRLALALADNARLFRTRPHLGLRASARHVRAALRSPAPAPPGWLAPDFAERTAAAERPRALELTRGDAIDVRSIGSEPFWTTLFLWGDPTFTRLPLRLRHPLADLRLLDFAARVPPEPWLMRKRILREAVKDLLPAPVLARPKTPLVRGRRPSITPAATARLAHLVRTLPEGERFFDVRALSDEVTALDAAANHAGNHQFVRAIGLVHWCAHWQRPEAAGLRLTDVRVRPDILEEKG
jgi:asparagine synthetase B (glutamine-hydrolysing)